MNHDYLAEWAYRTRAAEDAAWIERRALTAATSERAEHQHAHWAVIAPIFSFGILCMGLYAGVLG